MKIAFDSIDRNAADREVRQRRALRRNRAIATALLLVMVGTFIATSAVTEPNFWVSLIHSAAEAGVVGGLADWFAITALFRHPLGLPIPHTAVVPRNKNRIGEGLGAFLERHFLTDELVTSKLRGLDGAYYLARWLADPDRAAALSDRLVGVLPHVATALDDEELRVFTARSLGLRLRDIDVAPLLGLALRLLTAGGYHAAVLDRGLAMARDFLDRKGDDLEQAAADGTRRRWWIPAAVNKRIARAIIKGIGEILEELEKADSGMRQRMLSAVSTLAAELTTSPEHREKIEAAKRDLLDRPEIQAWLGSAWDQLRDLLLADLASEPSHVRQGLAHIFLSLGRSLQADGGMRARLNASIENAVLRLLPWRRELALFVAEVVHRWDEKVLVQRMELALGADLQYVRFTGTLVGAAIGCLLYLLTVALHHPLVVEALHRLAP
jgi:uncharacterized membrane-anchored protein YjiN (DUF445 family)